MYKTILLIHEKLEIITDGTPIKWNTENGCKIMMNIHIFVYQFTEIV
jgi:hypothetical protein